MNDLRPTQDYKDRVGAAEYRQLWRVVEGAVLDTIKTHPEYFTEIGATRKCVGSITKRVVGQMAGAANEARKRGGDSVRPYQAGPKERASQSSPAGRAAGDDRPRIKLPMIRLPWTKTSDLSRNSRKHWGKTHKLDKQQKKDAFNACLESGIHKHRPKKGEELIVTVIFCPPSGTVYPDMDNALTANKAALDQIAAILRVDDSVFRPIPIHGERSKHGGVLVSIEVVE